MRTPKKRSMNESTLKCHRRMRLVVWGDNLTNTEKEQNALKRSANSFHVSLRPGRLMNLCEKWPYANLACKKGANVLLIACLHQNDSFDILSSGRPSTMKCDSKVTPARLGI